MSPAVCPRCSGPVPGEARYCPSCGAPSSPDLSRSQTPTMVSAEFSSDTSQPGGKSRFVAGEIVAGRYRIEGMVGRGGMGEVYRAEDLRIGAVVALKFLPPSLQQNPAMLARFHSEVRLARQVSHPNVCRVHDIGEIGPSTGSGPGRHFLSMEFVDGENLASLLRRIGRLPGDKAIEIARQICAGLAAPHDRGVLHRDLKPENVMLDGQGRVRLMDFGLAAAKEDVRPDDLRSGTPAYMAPEQLDGREVTVQSDLYALGLVLHEMFTGRQIFDAPTLADLRRQRQTFTPERASIAATDVDPAVEQVIRRCLESDPEQRPASALAVAMALPGGDPLRAALAAGELPSPEMVAAAGATRGIPAWRAWAAVGLFVAGMLAAIGSSHVRSIAGRAPVSLPPEALAERARETLRAAGVDVPVVDRAYGFRPDREAIDWLRANGPVGDRFAPLSSLRIGATAFWHRQAPKTFQPVNLRGVVSPGDPNPLVVSGSTGLTLDEAGRLLAFQLVPPQVPGPAPEEPSEPDWSGLFRAADLDPGAFERAEPEWIPSVFADARVAWRGSWPEAPSIPLRIEAASFRGKPVWFEVVRPWSRPVRMQAAPELRSQRLAMNLNIALVVAALVGAVVAARKSVKSGRADARGASRVSFAIFLATLVGWGCVAHHQKSAQEEWGLFLQGVALALLLSGICCVLYLGLEPVVRKRLPHTLIGWSRLTAGWYRDPVVARDILFGLAAAGALGLLQSAVGAVADRVGIAAPSLSLADYDGTLGLVAFVGQIAENSVGVLLSPMLILLLLAVLTWLLRSAVAAFVVALLLIGTVAAAATYGVVGSAVVAIVAGYAAIGAMLYVLRTFGLLALMAMTLPNLMVGAFPGTLDPSHWFFGYTAGAGAVLLALALAALRWASPPAAEGAVRA